MLIHKDFGIRILERKVHNPVSPQKMLKINVLKELTRFYNVKSGIFLFLYNMKKARRGIICLAALRIYI